MREGWRNTTASKNHEQQSYFAASFSSLWQYLELIKAFNKANYNLLGELVMKRVSLCNFYAERLRKLIKGPRPNRLVDAECRLHACICTYDWPMDRPEEGFALSPNERLLFRCFASKNTPWGLAYITGHNYNWIHWFKSFLFRLILIISNLTFLFGYGSIFLTHLVSYISPLPHHSMRLSHLQVLGTLCLWTEPEHPEHL